MTRFLAIIILSLLFLSSCGSEITDSYAFLSPNKKLVVRITEELQGANDNAPWWTHISLNDSSTDSPTRIPGNILELKGHGKIKADWTSDNHVIILIDDSFWQMNSIPDSLEHSGIMIIFHPVKK